jgi:hypothetical protein
MERSKVARMPRELREQIEAMWRAGEFTIDELMAWLRERKPDADISRTGLGRYLAKFDGSFNRIREAQEVAARCVEKLGENPRGDVARLLSQLLGSLALTTLNNMGSDDEKQSPDTKDLFFLSSAIKNIAGAEKTSTDRELKVRAAMKAEIEKKLDETKSTGGGELDPAALEKAKELIRGIL